jgi:hypothetical protein
VGHNAGVGESGALDGVFRGEGGAQDNGLFVTEFLSAIHVKCHGCRMLLDNREQAVDAISTARRDAFCCGCDVGRGKGKDAMDNVGDT